MLKKHLPNLVFAVVIAIAALFYYNRYRVAPDIASRRVAFETPSGIDSLDSYLDQNLMVVFYASWCGPCMKEMPGLIAAQPKLEAANCRILALTDDPPAKIDLVKNRFQPNFPLYKLEGSLTDIDIYTIPTVFVMNKKGEVVFEHVDFLNWEDPDVANKIINLLN